MDYRRWLVFPRQFVWLCSGELGLAQLEQVAALAVFVARDPRFYSSLDALRGQNPRAQAAFIYAPGMCLHLWLCLLRWHLQVLERFVWQCVGLVDGAAVDRWSFGVARCSRFAFQYVRATMVLAEIDALWSIGQNDEAEPPAFIWRELLWLCFVLLGEAVAGDQVELLTLLSLSKVAAPRLLIIGLWFLGVIAAWNGFSGMSMLLECGWHCVLLLAFSHL